MPIKADLSTDNYGGSNNSSQNNSNTNISSSILNLNANDVKSMGFQNHKNSIKSQSESSEKFARFDGGEQQITVACRIRPLTEDEIIAGSTLISHKIAEDNMIVLMDPMEDPDDILRANRSRERQFVFDMVFDAKSTQQDVYEKTTRSLLGGVLNGYNATVFAYGATGAGKTHTMLGTEAQPGIMFRTLHDLFIDISKTNGDLIYQVSMSYLEIYNELIRDLLCPANGFLELREDAKGGIQIAGISELVAETPEEVMHMLHKGNKERTQEPTKANKTSSRSHAVLQVNIKQRNKVRAHTQEIRQGKLYMIDLAGSERAAQTQNTGKRMVEGAHINRSLLALGNCINALSEKNGSKYVNYRDSKLTRILKDSLGGNSKTVMIAHISPASIHFEESRNTLIYADRAKYIKTKLRRNVIDVSYHISQYQQIIQELAQEIASLKDQRTDLESRISHMDPRLISMNSEDKSKIEEAFKLRESLLQSFKQQLKLRKDILVLDNAIMDLNLEAERHNKIIDNWESQKENELMSENNNNNNNKKKRQTTNEMPDLVKNSKEELKVVEADRAKLATKRQDAGKQLEQYKQKTEKIKSIAAKKLKNSEQKEIIDLLLVNFDFEMKNIEIQAEVFKKDFQLREQDMVILRLEQHRSLCDTLIFQQRRLIVENNLSVPQDLDELFHLYSRDVNDGQLIKDLTGIRSTSNSSMATNSPKPNANAFLTQIQEENDEFSDPTTPINDDPTSFDRVFQKSNKLKAVKNAKKTNNNNNSNNQVSDYYSMNGNNNQNGSNFLYSLSNSVSKDRNNNLSMLSSSTNDSVLNAGAEVILENNHFPNNKFIKTPARNGNTSNTVNNNANRNNNNNYQPPGQVLQTSTNSDESSLNAKRLTQGIAAIAAQRKASQHHKELMQELYSDHSKPTNGSDWLTPSRLAKHDRLLNGDDQQQMNLLEKKNSVLTDGSNKTKKQVKIKEIVEYKLPDDYENDAYSKFQKERQNRRNSFDLVESHLENDTERKTFMKKKKSQKNAKRSKSINNQQTLTSNVNTFNKINNSNSTSMNNLSIQNGATSYATNNSKSNNINSLSKLAVPTIPNYSKGINMSISGTSVLKG